MDRLQIILNDNNLEPYMDIINSRIVKIKQKEFELLKDVGILKDFASGHLYFGLHKHNGSWILREWAPNASQIYLIGNFNHWKESKEYAFSSMGKGNWELRLPLNVLKHGDLYKLSLHWPGGQGERIPAWSKAVVQDKESLIFNTKVWEPEVPYKWKNPGFKRLDEPPLIYEAHIGMATEKEKIGSFNEFTENILQRIKRAGYNTVQLMAVQEHPYYGSFGYHVSSFFAPSSRFGTPEDLKKLVDEAHGMGLSVIMDLVHSHAVKNEIEGLARYDGTPNQFFHDGCRRNHPAWDSLCFDYGKNEVIHFLLSNCRYWLEEFKFDGFRFDGVTSMLYYDHGLGRSFTSYDLYFDNSQDEDAIIYLALANKLIHEINPGAITIAEEMSGMPGLAVKLADGGYGFDYRMAMGVPDYWIKKIKERTDEQWDVAEMYYELTNRRSDEKTIGYAESHDQAIVGDKTIIFRLIGKDMYYNMNKESENLKVSRGMALHKMIRLITITAAGSGYLNFMGNEYGHPEWIDFPREGNNWSYKYARRQWSLMDNKDLKYHYLADFDKDMIQFIKDSKILRTPFCIKLHDNINNQVLVFERCEYVFVFNFNPVKSFADYRISISPGKFKIVLNTDSKKYGGNQFINESMIYCTLKNGQADSLSASYLMLYIPSRTGFVLQRIKNNNRQKIL